MSNTNLDHLGLQVLHIWKEVWRRARTWYTIADVLTQVIIVIMSADWNLTPQKRVADQSTSHFMAFIRDAYSRMANKESSSRSGAELEEAYNTLLHKVTADGTADGNSYHLHLDAAYNRRIFFTDKAYIGLGPSMTVEGDLLCILFGGATPMILRPLGDSYRLIGECYVYDLISGEAVRDRRKRGGRVENFNLV
ncbi:hypothetical protein F4808DRAFT_410991 [Astrocystis sublimbata]|nr:hypothetical protein F4808DRAFT_410991 [Astrocystis sublimbata]